MKNSSVSHNDLFQLSPATLPASSQRPKAGALIGLLAVGLSVLVTGCASFGRTESRQSSSVVEYLYPKDNPPPIHDSIPVLNLPLKVGVAWVPSAGGRGQYAPAGAVSETQKNQLLEVIIPHFTTNAFIGSVEIIPSAYLTPGGGFRNLDQLQKLHGIDVIALVAYDQVQFTDRGALSLTYWTLVGAYVVAGERNETHTLMDVAVYDIASRRMLFRAPGTSQVRASATPVNLTEELRHDSQRGFEEASTNLVNALQSELDRFKARMKEHPTDVQVAHRPGYTGAGAIGWMELVVLGVGLAGCRRLRRKLDL